MPVKSKSTWLCLVFSFILLIGYAPRSNGAPSEAVDNRSNGLIDDHVVKGSYINIERAPYMISIEIGRIHACGGGIVNEYYAITAAHCVDTRVAGSQSSKRIRAGSTTEIPYIGWGGTIHEIEKAIPHPLYNLTTFDYDVGVIKVCTRFKYSQRVQAIPVAIGREDDFID